MNYSDYDSEDYSSTQDEDYVPSDGNLSEDDIHECEEEEPLHGGGAIPHQEQTRRRTEVRKKRARRLKKGGAREGGAQGQRPPEDHDREDEESRQKKSDDLWASFLSDVGPPPRTLQVEVLGGGAGEDGDHSAVMSAAVSVFQPKAPAEEPEPPGPATVTITKVFDFAGEEVRVNREVSADSREAKSFLKNQDQNPEQEESRTTERSPSSGRSPAPGPSVKRPAGVSGILSRIGGKKQKMSTLEKSRMDWDAFKCEEGITEELAIHNRGKEGYVERKNFLERVDHRRFELEKAVRLSNMKR